jgi:hypothetical protein
MLSWEVAADVLFVAIAAIAVIKHKCSLLKNLGFFMIVFLLGLGRIQSLRRDRENEDCVLLPWRKIRYCVQMEYRLGGQF